MELLKDSIKHLEAIFARLPDDKDALAADQAAGKLRGVLQSYTATLANLDAEAEQSRAEMAKLEAGIAERFLARADDPSQKTQRYDLAALIVPDEPSNIYTTYSVLARADGGGGWWRIRPGTVLAQDDFSVAPLSAEEVAHLSDAKATLVFYERHDSNEKPAMPWPGMEVSSRGQEDLMQASPRHTHESLRHIQAALRFDNQRLMDDINHTGNPMRNMRPENCVPS